MAISGGKSPNYLEKARARQKVRYDDETNALPKPSLSPEEANLLYAPVAVVASVSANTAAINDNASDIDDIETDISDLDTRITTNKNAITAVSDVVDTHGTSIGTINTTLLVKADLVSGTVPAAQLPSYVDDVLEFADAASLPVIGEAGKLYVTLDTKKIHRWTGTAYVVISDSLALGDTPGSAYPGNLGAANALQASTNATAITTNANAITANADAITDLDDDLDDLANDLQALATISTDNAITRFDGVAGHMQDSLAKITDAGSLYVLGEASVKAILATTYGHVTLQSLDNKYWTIGGGDSATRTVEMGTTTGDGRLKLVGDTFETSAMDIKTGNEGEGKRLTSNATGGVEWQDDTSLKAMGTFTANFAPTEPGIYTVDCANNIVNVNLPSAVGSQNRYVICFINNDRVNYGACMYQSGDTVNRIDATSRYYDEHTVDIVDAFQDKYTASGIQTLHVVNLYVPSQFPTIQDALDASLGFRSNSGTVQVILASGQYDVTAYLHCNHPQEVVIRGSLVQYFPRYDRGNDTEMQDDKALDKAAMIAKGGAILNINIGLNGLNLAYCPCVSFRYIQLYDNYNGTPDTTPANYVITHSSGRNLKGGSTWDRLLIFGSKYGLSIGNLNFVTFNYMVLMHQTTRALYIEACTKLSIYRLAIWYTRHGIYAYRQGYYNISRLEAYLRGTSSHTSSRALLLSGHASVYLTYPQIYTHGNCMEAHNGAWLRVGMTTSTTPINETVLKGSNLAVVRGSKFLMTGGATTNRTFEATSSYALDCQNASVILGAHMRSASGLPVNKRLRLRFNSTGLGITPACDLDLVPDYQTVIGTDSSQWFN